MARKEMENKENKTILDAVTNNIMVVSPVIDAECRPVPDRLTLPSSSAPDAYINISKNKAVNISISSLQSEGSTESSYKFDTCSLGSADDEYESSSYLSKGSLPLTPYSHQVGGHAALLRFSDRALCKPLDRREQSFYEKVTTTHPTLLPFLAAYMGVVNVSFRPIPNYETAPVLLLENNQHLLHDYDDVDSSDSSNPTNSPARNYYRKLQQQVFKEALSPRALRSRAANFKPVQDFGNVPKAMDLAIEENKTKFNVDQEEMFQMSEDDEFKVPVNSSFTPRGHSVEILKDLGGDPGTPKEVPTTPKSSRYRPRSIAQQSVNPWSTHLYNTKLPEMQTNMNDPEGIQKFLLLEDLTAGLNAPCILDLKMGTRQHGVYATPEKKASQERKCERSTSKKLGTRICGMQLYRYDTQSYRYMDKYFGRQINVSNFKQNLLSFFDNGTHYLIGFIPELIEKLLNLHRVVSEMTTARFYASSLLIFYDGDMNSTRKAEIKMIDFANCITAIKHDVPYPPTTDGADGGYMLGLQTLIKNLEEIRVELGSNGVLTERGHVSKETVTKKQVFNAGLGNLPGV